MSKSAKALIRIVAKEMKISYKEASQIISDAAVASVRACRKKIHDNQ